MWKKIWSTDDQQWVTIPLRIALGVIFLSHGGQKLFGWLGGKGLEGTAGFFAGKLGLTPGMVWATLAGIAEFGGGLLVLLGLFTRLGAFCIATVMLVAIFKVHWGAFFMPTGMESPSPCWPLPWRFSSLEAASFPWIRGWQNMTRMVTNENIWP